MISGPSVGSPELLAAQFANSLTCAPLVRFQSQQDVDKVVVPNSFEFVDRVMP